MRPFDFNVHLVPASGSVDEKIGTELDQTVDEAIGCYLACRSEAASLLSGLNLMLFNQRWTQDPSCLAGLQKVVSEDFGRNFAFTQLVDFRNPPGAGYFARASAVGVRGIKFHCYVQRISEADWPAVAEWAAAATASGMFVCIDASYGSLGMYEFDNLRLTAWLASRIPEARIIVLHSGGLRVLEAWLLAESNPRIWLETSFSLPYYRGTRIEDDLALAYRRLGPGRVIYASDYPYVGFAQSHQGMVEFLGKHGFSEFEADQVLHGAVRALVPGAG